MVVQAGEHASFLAAGLAATIAQVLLLRELLVDVAGDEAAIGVGLAAWLIGIALGARIARWRLGARDESVRKDAAALGLALLALLPPAALVLGRVLRHPLCPSAGELPGLGATLGLASTTLLPCGVAVGGTFTALAAAAARAWRGGEALARLYVVESLGSLVGGVVATLGGGHVSSLRLAALAGLGAALLAANDRAPGAGRRLLLSAAALSALMAAFSSPLDAWSERTRFAGLAPGVPFLASVETPYQHLALGGGAVRHLYASGQYSASFPDPYAAESLGHLLALLAVRPQRVLVIGGVETGIAPVLLRHPVAALTLVEPDRAAFAFVRSWLPPEERTALADPRLSVVHDDARRFLANPATGTFDLVVLLGREPVTLLRARLATVETFRLVARHLSPEGVLVAGLPAAPAVLSGESEALAAVLVRSLREALPVVHVSLPGEALAVAGLSPSAVTLDAHVLAARWRSRGVVSASFDAALLPVLFPVERVAAHEAALFAAAGRAEASQDDRPLSFLHALARRQEIVSGVGGRLLRMALAAPLHWLVALTFVPSLVVGAVAGLGRRFAPGRSPGRDAVLASHAVAVSGAAGLGWSLLLLLSFQTQAGALYGQLGGLVALFMLGLALGGALVGAEARRFHARAEGGVLGDEAVSRHAQRVLRACIGAAALFGATLPLALAAAARVARGDSFRALLAYGAALVLAGIVTGAVFPAAAELRLASDEAVATSAGHLETVDHVGAAAAALSAAVVFLPRLGLARSALLLAGLQALALVLLARSPRAARSLPR